MTHFETIYRFVFGSLIAVRNVIIMSKKKEKSINMSKEYAQSVL